jgi:hypothetical protein
MAEGVYILCALTSLLCAVLLGRSYQRSSSGLLLWSSLCFSGLALNNALLFIDLVLVPSADLSLLRHGTALLALCIMTYGLIMESE